MIIKTIKELNGVEYEYVYSDAGMLIERDDNRYAEAFDPVDSGREYIETDEPVESAKEATIEDYQNALAEFGVEA